MKNSVTTFILFFLLSYSTGHSSSFRVFVSDKKCLEIDGKITNASESSEKNCVVELICENKIVSTLVLKGGKKKFKFLLDKNAVYSIRISKTGYISKLINIDTKMNMAEVELYNFSFETSLIKKSSAEHLNKDLLDLPVALIYFDRKKDCFVYDKEYSNKIKKEFVMK